MKLVIDEKLKHRLVGLAVVLSLGAIFLPAMMKKSSQRLENHFSVNVQLPPKPEAPKVVMTDEKGLFQTIKVANIEPVKAPQQKNARQDEEDYIQSVHLSGNAAVKVANAKPVAAPSAVAKPIELALVNATREVPKKQVKLAVVKSAISAASVKKANPVQKQVAVRTTKNRPLKNKEVYAVQLATFSQLPNAQALVNKLRGKGFKANYAKIATPKGAVYKVYAGHSPVKSDALKLKNQLASAMQLNGFVVNTGVS